MVRLLLALVWSFAMVLFACEFGERMVEQFDVINDLLFQCDWHVFPVEMQRIFIIVLANTQRHPVVTGFGNVECVREFFKKVMQSRKFRFSIVKCHRPNEFFSFHFSFALHRQSIQASPIS